MTNCFFFSSLIFIFFCFATSQSAGRQKSLSKQNSDSARIRFDGIYNTWDTSRLAGSGERMCDVYKSLNFSFFTPNKKAYSVKGATMDYSFEECKFYGTLNSKDFGEYKIIGDSIFASIPTVFILGGMRYKQLKNPAHFRGYIKNRDTILDWHIIPPYPLRMRKFIREQNAFLITPHVLYFMHNDGIKCLPID